ncbi:MAG: hypothetical protein ABW321_19700 [Polyangiales bacterium]
MTQHRSHHPTGAAAQATSRLRPARWLSLLLAALAAVCAGTVPTTASAAHATEIASVSGPRAGADLFVIDADQSIKHYWRSANTADWSAFEQLDGLARDIAAVELGGGLFEVFVVGLDGDVWSNRQLGPLRWSGFHPLGRTVNSQKVAVAKTRSGRFELFMIGDDNAVWKTTRSGPDGHWTTWRSLGGIASQLSAAQAADGSVHVFAVGNDRAIWLSESDRPGWHSLGGVASDVAVGRGEDGRLSVFAVGKDAAVWQRRAGNKPLSFEPWQSMRGRATRIAASGSSAAHGLFALGSRAEVLQHSAERWLPMPSDLPLETLFHGRATLTIPSINVTQHKRLELGIRFDASRNQLQVTSFPTLDTKSFNTPFGDSRSLITLSAGGRGRFDPRTGELELPLTLHFDQTLDVPLIEEDADLVLVLKTSNPSAQPLQADSGRIQLTASSHFSGGGGINPLRNKACDVSISGHFNVPPGLLLTPR